MSVETAPRMSVAEKPPRLETGVLGWIRTNLFSSPTNIGLSLVGLWLIYVAFNWLFDFAVAHATWHGVNGEDCRPNAGACWPMIEAKFPQFIYGRYPEDQRWRVNFVYVLAIAGLVPLMIPRAPFKVVNAALMFLVFPFVAFVLLLGGDLHPLAFGHFLASLPLVGRAFSALASWRIPTPLPFVGTELWGGLLVTLVVAWTGIVASFPIGIILALGRRSRMPVARWASVAFIEFVRGVPLITVLFMSSVMLPLFLPPGWRVDNLLRALIGVGLFSGAYMAETIRGGLQAIPRGQFEGADALGLSYRQKMALIVLPQALKLVIPGIVNSFISLFKDTSLVTIIGLFDLLGVVQANNVDQKWLAPSNAMTGYLFAGFIFWCFCFGMSRYSAFVERYLASGEKR